MDEPMQKADLLFAGHRAECAECRATLGSLEKTSEALPQIDPVVLSAMTRQRLAPLLAERRSEVWQRQVAVGLVLALIPLPFVIAWDAVLLRWLYGAASELLPARVVGYALASYGAAMALLIGLTYASIPVWFARRVSGRTAKLEWNLR